jgi:hypothetical protein
MEASGGGFGQVTLSSMVPPSWQVSLSEEENADGDGDDDDEEEEEEEEEEHEV